MIPSPEWGKDRACPELAEGMGVKRSIKYEITPTQPPPSKGEEYSSQGLSLAEGYRLRTYA